jgi:hypothetical protein
VLRKDTLSRAQNAFDAVVNENGQLGGRQGAMIMFDCSRALRTF